MDQAETALDRRRHRPACSRGMSIGRRCSLAHGATKVLLVLGLPKGKLWSCPASLVALGLFIAYELYRFSYTHSPGLTYLTVFDLLVVVLIWHQCRLVHRNLPARRARCPLSTAVLTGSWRPECSKKAPNSVGRTPPRRGHSDSRGPTRGCLGGHTARQSSCSADR